MTTRNSTTGTTSETLASMVSATQLHWIQLTDIAVNYSNSPFDELTTLTWLKRTATDLEKELGVYVEALRQRGIDGDVMMHMKEAEFVAKILSSYSSSRFEEASASGRGVDDPEALSCIIRVLLERLEGHADKACELAGLGKQHFSGGIVPMPLAA